MEEKEMFKNRDRLGRNFSAAAFLVAMTLQPLAASADDSATREVNKNEREAAHYAPDNTGRNARDLNPARPTADNQAYGIVNGSQNETLARIRREIVANDNLSIMAKNVKILIENNQLTLRGPVKTTEERDWIASAAARTASGYQLNNQLEVASK